MARGKLQTLHSFESESGPAAGRPSVFAKIGRGSKKGRQVKASIVFLDESGLLLRPLNRRTWAPQGMRLVQYASQRHDRLSVIGSLSLSPRNQRIGVAFQVQLAVRHGRTTQPVLRAEDPLEYYANSLIGDESSPASKPQALVEE